MRLPRLLRRRQASSRKTADRRGRRLHVEALEDRVCLSGFAYGLPGDISFTGDWDGDGVETPGIFRDGRFHLRNSNTSGPGELIFAYGLPGDTPVVGDWDGDGVDTVGVVRGTRWFLRNSNDTGFGELVFTYGLPGDVPIAGDWDGDGDATPGVLRAAPEAQWYLRNSNDTGIADLVFTFGSDATIPSAGEAIANVEPDWTVGPADVPLVGDWDGDGIESVGLFTGGTWRLKNAHTSGNAEQIVQLGSQGDAPVVFQADIGPLGGLQIGVVRHGFWMHESLPGKQPDHLDPSFGFDGRVLTQVDALTFPKAMAIQDDGKILVGTFGAEGSDSLLIRYLPDGSLDTSFGDGGGVVVSQVRQIGLQSDGKIIVLAFEVDSAVFPSNWSVARYLPDGSIDATFGDGGKATLPDPENAFGNVRDMAIQPDDKIVVVGQISETVAPFTIQSDFAIVRFDRDGEVDVTFGTDGDGDGTPDGHVVTPVTSNRDAAFEVAIQEDGKIVVAGQVNASPYLVLQPTVPGGNPLPGTLGLVRYNPDGSLDTTFGEGGIAIPDIGPAAANTMNLMLQPDGKIVVASRAHLAHLARFNSDGSLDTTFGTNGVVAPNRVSRLGAARYDAALQADGKIVVVGSLGEFVAIDRYNADGSLDTSFGGDGTVEIDWIPSWLDPTASVAIDPDGRIVVAGWSLRPYQSGTPSRLLIALGRYLPTDDEVL